MNELEGSLSIVVILSTILIVYLLVSCLVYISNKRANEAIEELENDKDI